MQPRTPPDQGPQQPLGPTDQNTQPAQPQGVRKNRKALIIWLIAGGVVLLAAIAVLVIYLTMFNISKDDYKKALDTTKSVNEKTEAINGIVVELSSDDNEKIAEAQPKVHKSIEDARTEMDKLRKEKALNDKDVKEKSDAYLTKLDKTITYLSNYATDLGSLRIIINECSAALETKLGNGSASELAASLNKMGNDLTECTNKLEQAQEKMKSDDAQALANSFVGPYKTLAQQSKLAGQAASAGDFTAYDQASTKMNQALEEMTTNSIKALEQTTDHIKAIDPTEAYGALVAVLEGKTK